MVLFCRDFFPVRRSSHESGHGDHATSSGFTNWSTIKFEDKNLQKSLKDDWKSSEKSTEFFCLLEIFLDSHSWRDFCPSVVSCLQGRISPLRFFFRCFHRKNDDIPNEPRREKRPSFFSLPKSPRVRHQRRHLATGWFVYTRLCRDEQVRPGWHDSKMVELGTSHFP